MSGQQSYWDRQHEFIHPFISFLVSGISEMRNLEARHNSLELLYYLNQFVIYLDPEIKKGLASDRQAMADMLVGKKAYTEGDVLKIVENVMDALHKAGYFAGARFKTVEIGGEHT
jgi:hypothetical protein